MKYLVLFIYLAILLNQIVNLVLAIAESILDARIEASKKRLREVEQQRKDLIKTIIQSLSQN